MKYLNTTYASDARSVGSLPNNKNSEAGYYTSSESYMSNYNGKLRDGDENYKADFDQMKELGLLFMMLCMVFAVNAQELKKGDKLPDFHLKSAVYGDISSTELKGKVVLVSLFATWCGPCQLELAEIEKTLWAEYKDNKDFVLLVIGREHTDEQLKAYNERKKFTFPLYPDPKREVFSLFAEKSIPRAYLFNKEGEAVYTSIGYEKEEFGYLMNAIAEALK